MTTAARDGGSPLGALVKNEWHKVFRLNKFYLFLVAIVAIQVIQVVQWRVAPATPGAMAMNGQSFPLAVLRGSPLWLALLISVLVADAVADEYTGGTLKLTLLRPVGRATLMTAKALTVSAIVIVAVCAVAVSAYAVGAIAFTWGDGLLYDGTVINESVSGLTGLLFTGKAVLASTVAACGFAMLVLFIATVTMNVGATIGVAMAFFVLSPLIEGHVRQFSIVYTWHTLPAAVLLDSAGQQLLTGIGVTAAYIALFYTGSVWLLKRKDVLL